MVSKIQMVNVFFFLFFSVCAGGKTHSGIVVKRCRLCQRDGSVMAEITTIDNRTASMISTLETGTDTSRHQLCNPATLIGRHSWTRTQFPNTIGQEAEETRPQLKISDFQLLFNLFSRHFYSNESELNRSCANLPYFQISTSLWNLWINSKQCFFFFADATASTVNLNQRRIDLLLAVKVQGLSAILKTLKLCGEQNHHLHLVQSCVTAIAERSATEMSADRCPCLIDQLVAEHRPPPLPTPVPPETAATLAGRLMGEWIQNKEMSGTSEFLFVLPLL